MQQEATFPVACCGRETPFDKIKELLAPHIKLPYKAMAAQFAVPNTERIFCSGGCGSFLGSSSSAVSLTCAKCKLATCTSCKAQEHVGQCGADDAALTTLAETQGWQTCAGCNAVVELNEGCNHISYVYPKYLV